MAVERTDAELIEACQRGDARAFETLYRRHRDWVVSLAFRFCGNHDDALDVLQETFHYLLRKLPGLRLSAKLTTFLYPAVKHRAIDRRRAATRMTALPAEEPVGMHGLPLDVREVWATLGPPQREVLELRFLEGFSLDEIAATLRLPVGTVKSRLHYALAALRQKIGEP